MEVVPPYMLTDSLSCRAIAPYHVRHGGGLLPFALGLLGAEVLGCVLNDPLRPSGAEGHTHAPPKEVVGHPVQQFRYHRRVQVAHVIGELPGVRHAKGRIVGPERRPRATALEGPDREWSSAPIRSSDSPSG